MSTLLLAMTPGQSLETLDTSGVSAGSGMQTANSIELQINQATTLVNDGGSTRQIQREEVIVALTIMTEWIQRSKWPYAAS